MSNGILMFCINCPNYANIIFSMFGLLKSKKDKYNIIIESEEWSSQ